MGWGLRLFVITPPFLRDAAIDSVRYQETGAHSLYFSQSLPILNFPRASQVTRFVFSCGRRALIDAQK